MASAYAASVSAIIVSPDHHLFPSASTSDILSVEDLWQWIQTNLPEVLSSRASGYEVDLAKIMVEGNSAGGFCAVRHAISYATSIYAAILVYPMVDCLSPYLAKGPPKNIAASAPCRGKTLDEKIVPVHQKGWVCQSRDQDGILLNRYIMKDGRFGEMFSDEEHNPLHRVAKLEHNLSRT